MILKEGTDTEVSFIHDTERLEQSPRYVIFSNKPKKSEIEDPLNWARRKHLQTEFGVDDEDEAPTNLKDGNKSEELEQSTVEPTQELVVSTQSKEPTEHIDWEWAGTRGVFINLSQEDATQADNQVLRVLQKRIDNLVAVIHQRERYENKDYARTKLFHRTTSAERLAPDTDLYAGLSNETLHIRLQKMFDDVKLFKQIFAGTEKYPVFIFGRKNEGNRPTELQYSAYVEGFEDIIPRYIMVAKPMGKGSFGVIWVGWDLLRNAPIAVKSLNEARQLGGIVEHKKETFENLQKRLLLEGKTQGKNENLRTVTMLDIVSNSNGDSAYLVMEYLNPEEWKTFSDLVKESANGAISLSLFLKIATEMLTLHHEFGTTFAHRDWKLSNLFLSQKGENIKIKISDFGLGIGVTGDDDIVGTLEYSPPDSLWYGGHRRDSRDDLFSIAIILLKLTGEKGFYQKPNSGIKDEAGDMIVAADSLTRTFYDLGNKKRYPILHQWLLDQGLSQEQMQKVLTCFNRALEPERWYRYTTAQEFLKDLLEAFS